ncbi:hypothetical protein BDL97_18G063100 [Sphagnum fallax]|nr:hypothetical protein BDL97_18G063100 [Sphagnum fallax]
MWSLISSSFIALLLLQCIVTTSFGTTVAVAASTTLQTPPPGNTLSMTCTAQNGQRMYKCLEGKWVYQGGESKLLDAQTYANVGVYREMVHPVTKTILGWWEIVNDSGDDAESGYQYSTVTGKVIDTVTTQTSTSLLCVATQHGNMGATTRISYIAILGAKGGAAPPQSLCKQDEVVEVPFTAGFAFYTQDTSPPTLPTPISAKLGSSQAVESFYAQGAVRYSWTGTSWTTKSVTAQLSTVPGGPVVGKFSVLPKPDRYGGRLNWVVFNPNGFSVTGRGYTAPVLMSDYGLGWQLVQITSSSGPALEGPYRYVLMTSTMGGLQPVIKPTTEEKCEGLVITSTFSCVFWIYTT